MKQRFDEAWFAARAAGKVHFYWNGRRFPTRMAPWQRRKVARKR